MKASPCLPATSDCVGFMNPLPQHYINKHSTTLHYKCIINVGHIQYNCSKWIFV